MLSKTELEMKSVVIWLLITSFYGVIPLFPPRSHIYVAQTMSWRDALQYCRLNYDDLSTIRNADENDMMMQAKPNSCNAVFSSDCRLGRWTGLHSHRYDDSLVWKWAWEEEDVTFTMWADKESHMLEPDSCGYQDPKTGKWYAASCFQNLTFYCMAQQPRVTLVQSNKTWEEALDYCRDNYTDLASLRSYKENNLAVRKSQAAGTAHVWIGLHFVVRYWIWVDGHALEYQAWSEDEHPTCPARKLRCGALETRENIWKARDCEEKLNFLCFENFK